MNMTNTHFSSFAKLFAIFSTILVLQGCVTAAVLTVGTAVKASTDRRTLGHQIDDQGIELRAYSKLSGQKSLKDKTNIQLSSLNGILLVVGQAPTEPLRAEVIKVVNKVKGIKKIFNQIRISNTTSILTKSNDTWLTSKVKFALLKDKHIDGSNIKVITENGEVFLMGIVNQTEADIAVNIARNVSGVNRVLKAFEYR